MKKKYENRRQYCFALICVLAIMISGVFLLPRKSFAQIHSLSFIEEELTISPDAEANNALTGYVAINNNGPEVTGLSFTALLKGKDGVVKNYAVKVEDGGESMAAYSVASFKLNFSAINHTETLSGTLVVSANESVESAVIALTIEFPKDESFNILGITAVNPDQIVGYIFWIALIAFAGIVLLSCDKEGFEFKDIFKGKIILISDFKKSWASTLTVFSAVLTSAVGSNVFPEEPVLMTKKAYQLLIIFFPILVAISAFLVAALGKLTVVEKKEKDDAETEVTDTMSKAWPLLIGAPIVLAAMTGELATLTLLMEELAILSYISQSTATLIQIVLLVVILVGFVYVIDITSKQIVASKTTGKRTVIRADGKRSEIAVYQKGYLP